MTLFLQPDKMLKYKLWPLHVSNKRDPTSPRDRIYGSKLLFLLVCRSSKIKHQQHIAVCILQNNQNVTWKDGV